jgi:hypothetical protein
LAVQALEAGLILVVLQRLLGVTVFQYLSLHLVPLFDLQNACCGATLLNTVEQLGQVHEVPTEANLFILYKSIIAIKCLF